MQSVVALSGPMALEAVPSFGDPLLPRPEQRWNRDESPGEFKYHEAGSTIHRGNPEEKESAQEVHEVVSPVPGPQPPLCVREIGEENQRGAEQRDELIEHEGGTKIRGVED